MTRCDKCGKYFSGIKNFDAHRTGEFYHPAYKKDGINHPVQPFTRRCLTTEEMVARGFAIEKKPQREEWYLVQRREALSRQLERQGGTLESEREAS